MQRLVTALFPRRVFLAAFSLFALALSGCDLFEDEEGDPPPATAAGVYVGNGGNFSEQNGFVTVYDPGADAATSPAYLDVGAFLNSLYLDEERLYALLNTGFSSGRVSLFDLQADALVAQSDSLGAVRHLALAAPGKAYVTVLDGTVAVLDPATLATRATLDAGASAAGLAVAAGKAFVANYATGAPSASGDGTTLTVIDVATDAVTGTVDLGCDGPKGVFVDEEGEVVVVCTGRTDFDEDFNVVGTTDGAVVFVDAEAESVTGRVPFDVPLGSAGATQVAHYAKEAEALHAISSSAATVFRIDTGANALAKTIAVPPAEGLTGLAAVAYASEAQQLYLARLDAANPFTASGSVVILDEEGAEAGRFSVGPAPAHIALRR